MRPATVFYLGANIGGAWTSGSLNIPTREGLKRSNHGHDSTLCYSTRLRHFLLVGWLAALERRL